MTATTQGTMEDGSPRLIPDHAYENSGRGFARCSCGGWSVRLSDLSTDEERAGTYAYAMWDNHVLAITKMQEADGTFLGRIGKLVSEIELGMNCTVKIGRDEENTPGRFYFQIRCWRRDVITGEMGYGYGGKAYLSEHATDSELIQTIFGLYKGYWEHEARETFVWRGRRPFGPHIATEALWEVARRVDVRSAKHIEDIPAPTVHPDAMTEFDLSSGGV